MRRTLIAPAVAVLAGVVLAAPPQSNAVGSGAGPGKGSGVTYSWEPRPTGTDEQYRGLAAVSHRVAWVSGESGSVLRTTDAGRTWLDVSPPGADGLALRDIEAWDARHAVALSIGTGEDSRILRTADGGRTWREAFRNTDPAAFYDCMAFSRSGRGIAMSDPVGGYFQIAQSNDFGRSWSVRSNAGMPPALDGEFGFAASGTCVVAGAFRNFWFVTGGVDVPRVFHSRDGGRTWSVDEVPMRGGPSAGIYSVDFRAAGKGVAVGGDYVVPEDGADASAYLSYPSGPTWRSSPSPVLGYRSGVAWVPHARNTAIAVGPTGSDVSRDGGRTWASFDGAAYDGIHCAAAGACWASGPDGAVATLVRHRP
jgi:photosystem II stability/assembly factor-like uncharacterized protein